MGITLREWQEFEKRMDERHKRQEELHVQVMVAIESLPCRAHDERINGLEKLRWKAGGVVAAAMMWLGMRHH